MFWPVAVLATNAVADFLTRGSVMLLVEDGRGAVVEGHYRFQQVGTAPEQRTAAEQFLQRQGCTKVVHYVSHSIEGEAQDSLLSIGFIERIEVVRQRAREPRYD